MPQKTYPIEASPDRLEFECTLRTGRLSASNFCRRFQGLIDSSLDRLIQPVFV